MNTALKLALVAILTSTVSLPALADVPLDQMIQGKCPATALWLRKLAVKHNYDVRAAPKVTMTDPRTAAAFATRAKADADSRNAVAAELPRPSQKVIDHVKAVDADNQAYLRGYMAAHGFPTVAAVGPKGVRDAWYIAQHADADRGLQERVLDALKARENHGQVEMQDVAMLQDRLDVANGRPQQYGTQMANVGGKLVSHEPVNREGIDARREAVGLMPLADYTCMMNALPH